MPCGDSTSLLHVTTPCGIVQAENRSRTIAGWLHEGDERANSVDAVIGETFHKVLGDVRGAYLHVPFCFHKCHYCDFYSIVDSQDRQQAFVERLIRELRAVSTGLTRPLESIFIGGGTPTLLSVECWRRLLPAISECLPLTRDAEFSVEANPETVTAELADVLVSGGVNRFSIGAQSFNPRHLKALERWHDPKNVHRSAEILRAAGVDNFNLDLIFAVPGQSVAEWKADLDEALSLKPAHISCYGLMYEHNTPLTVRMKAGEIIPVEQDVEAAMYEATIDRLAAAGFEHYEISNWARRDASGAGDGSKRCRHNLLYWFSADWWAFGPSASGHVSGVRWKNVPRLGEYLDHGPLPHVVDVERVTAEQRIGEAFMLGLRLIDGMNSARVEQLLSGAATGEARRRAIQRHTAEGLLEHSEDRLRLTRRGLLLADRVLSDLI